MKHKRRAQIVLCVIFATGTLCAFITWWCFGTVLALVDTSSGKVVKRIVLDAPPNKNLNNTAFSVRFKHSVNKSDVEEGYSINQGKIYLEWCVYSAFGAGVADNLDEGLKLTMLENGDMRIEAYHRYIPHLVYTVSTVYDHFITVGKASYNLTELGLKNKSLEFKIKRGRW